VNGRLDQELRELIDENDRLNQNLQEQQQQQEIQLAQLEFEMHERDVLNDINMELQELLKLEQNRVRELIDENDRLNQNLQNRAAHINLNGLHEDLAQMNQQLLRGQAYEQQQFNNIRILQRDNHEAEVLNIRRVEEELRSLFRNENNRPQQGNRDRR
jgi:hypothetical protein